MFLIASAAYVDAELQAEFGRLPPTFLPVGNRRLYEHQIELIRNRLTQEPLVLSLPESFELPPKDQIRLAQLGVQIIATPEPLSLAESVLYAINAIGRYNGGVRILHGDTLFKDLPTSGDCLTVGTTFDHYDWHFDTPGDASSGQVWTGYFAFSSAARLARTLVGSRGRFEQAVEHYGSEQPLARLPSDQWLDFGHVNTFFRSRSHITTQRAFNDLQIDAYRVLKTGTPSLKIEAEARWFASLPRALRGFAPQLLESGENTGGSPGYAYELEYLCMAPLNELYVHGNLPGPFWTRIFKHLASWLSGANNSLSPTDPVTLDRLRAEARGLLAEKSLTRLQTYLATSGLDGDRPTAINGHALPSLRAIAADCIARSDPDAVVPGILHGDLCFSNILFDSRANRLKLIDPRGLDHQGNFSNQGDLRYDLAKLAHSVIGLYDYLIAGSYDLKVRDLLDFELKVHTDHRVREAQRRFLETAWPAGLSVNHILPQVVLLFLSMLPLHADHPERQQALLANALRLYTSLQH